MRCAPHLAMLRPALGFCTGAEAFGERVRYVRHSAGSGLRVGGISPRVLLLGLPTTTATAQWATAFGARGVWSATALFHASLCCATSGCACASPVSHLVGEFGHPQELSTVPPARDIAGAWRALPTAARTAGFAWAPMEV